MIVRFRCFQTQKSGNRPEELEDAARPQGEGEVRGDLFLAAAADGASEGYLSGEWASLLVEEYCRDLDEWEELLRGADLDLADLVQAARQNWAAFLQGYLAQRQAENRPIQWYEEPGLENGAFSTLLGLAILQDRERGAQYWFTGAVGDTCLFQVRGDECVAAFPLHNAAGFNTWPALVSSRPAQDSQWAETIRRAFGDWQAGDCFYLMTDALAAWFLGEIEAGRRPWRLLGELAGTEADDFTAWIEALRGANQIKNDDVTLICLALAAG